MNDYWWVLLLCVTLITAQNRAFGSNSSADFSPMEHPATDVPLNADQFTWTVQDTISGKKVGTNGAPVVEFRNYLPKVVGSLPSGAVIRLTAVQVYKGVNYWAVDYADSNGEQQNGWLSGMFIKRN